MFTLMAHSMVAFVIQISISLVNRWVNQSIFLLQTTILNRLCLIALQNISNLLKGIVWMEHSKPIPLGKRLGYIHLPKTWLISFSWCSGIIFKLSKGKYFRTCLTGGRQSLHEKCGHIHHLYAQTGYNLVLVIFCNSLW